MKHWTDKLAKLHACTEAVTWARTQPDLGTAWQECKRGDWLLWLAGKLAGAPGSDARRPLVLAACECARLALKHVPKGEGRPLKAIETAEAWARGEAGITLQDVRTAYGAAYADAAYADAYAYAAAAAAAAFGAADAYAYAYADAYADADADAARTKVLAKCAVIVRKHYPKAPVLP